MEITKELKEKLMKAGSLEEVKGLLGDQATKEEVAELWNQIQPKKAAEELGTLEDDDLEGVVGGVAFRKPEDIVLPVVPSKPQVKR